MINLENFKYVNMNRDNTVTVGTGALFGDLVNTLYANNREITVGSCPCVGATGAMLGGGLGRLQGLHGMNSDALRRVKVALYNGTIIEASDRVNQDLFWGIRGAGQNFGIVLESTFETWPATNNGQHYNADLYFNKRDLTRVMDIVNRLAHPRMDPLLNLIPFIAYNTTTQEVSLLPPNNT
jgi:FAD/FMN-containing dehydrogenase